MDDSLRRQIIDNLAKPAYVQKTIEPITESVSDDRLFEFRNQLKSVHAYEKICKIDSEEWDEDTWSAFESWQKENTPKKSFDDLIDSVAERRKAREDLDESKKSELRKKIIACLNF